MFYCLASPFFDIYINNFAHSMFAQHFNKHVSFGLCNCYEYYVLFLYKTTSVVTLSIST